MEKVLTVEETSQILRVSTPVAYDLIKSGKLPAVRCGRQWRITESAVQGFLNGGGRGDSQRSEIEKREQAA